MKKIIGLLFLVPLLFASCNSDKTVRMVVASQQGDCIGVAPQKCLFVKIGSDTDWSFFYNQIEGFNYEEGYEYVLEVKEEKQENVPADASSIKYVLVKEVSKTPTTSEGLPTPTIAAAPDYEWVARVLTKENTNIGRGAAQGKADVTVLGLLVTGSQTDLFNEGDTIYSELVNAPVVVPNVGEEYAFKAKSAHPAHALGTYMLETDVQNLVE